uniref:Putative secreted protein n=1 Tax=Ixodes ricinus TaxID=34613 RepID=A0A6B0UIE3_IXORI
MAGAATRAALVPVRGAHGVGLAAAVGHAAPARTGARQEAVLRADQGGAVRVDPRHPGGDLAGLPGSRSSPVEARVPRLGSHGKPVANKSARVPGGREAPGG